MAKRSTGKKKVTSARKSPSKQRAVSNREGQNQKTGGSGPEKLVDMRIALTVVSLASVAIALYFGYLMGRSLGWQKGVQWGLIVGVSVWAAFYGSYRLNRWLRR